MLYNCQIYKCTMTLVVNMGKTGNLNKYTLKTDGSKGYVVGTDYKASATIIDVRTAINVHGLTQ